MVMSIRALKIPPEQWMDSDEHCRATAAEFENTARYIAQHLDQREEIVANLSTREDIWSILKTWWDVMAHSLDPTRDTSISSEELRIDLAVAVAKLERNLIAGLIAYQQRSFEHEDSLRRLIFNITTFTRIEDPKFFNLQAVLAQLLSNTVSPISDEPDSNFLADQILPKYLSGRREDDVIIRLLDSKDVKINSAILHLLHNITRSCPSRQQKLLDTVGTRWLSKILGKMDEWHEHHDNLFEQSCGIFNQFLDSGYQSRLLTLLSDDSEPITPSQTTLLKLLDSHLASSSRLDTRPSPSSFLISFFHHLASYAVGSLRSGQDDSRLPKVLEGLILTCEALSSIGLAVQSRIDKGQQKKKARVDMGGDEDVVVEMKDAQKGVINPLITLLRQVDIFMPRVKPGQKPAVPLTPEQLAPMSSLKRNIVRLLGILTFEDVNVGDQVRECEGVQLVLSLTEVDESNPYLREHALFAVRNLMLDNPANQDIISQMDPVGVVSDTGEVLPLPERMRRQRQRTARE